MLPIIFPNRQWLNVDVGLEEQLLKALAAAGFAAYVVDLRGYAATARAPGGWLTPRQCITDVEAVLAFVAGRHPDLAPPVLLGWSRGSKIAALTATLGTARVSALILYALTFDPDAAPLNGPASGEAPAAANSADAARSDFISPDVADPGVVQDFVRTALDTDPIRVDVCCDAEFLAIDPARIRTPHFIDSRRTRPRHQA